MQAFLGFVTKSWDHVAKCQLTTHQHKYSQKCTAQHSNMMKNQKFWASPTYWPGWSNNTHLLYNTVIPLAPPPHHNRFTALFLGPPGWAGARRELLDFMVQGKINRGRHTAHQAGRHHLAHLHHPSYFLQAGWPSCRQTNSVKALKATNAFGLGKRR